MHVKYSAHKGFTLVEVMLALLIMAMIAIASGAAFQSAARGGAAAREAMERLAQIDRAFVLIENDLRNTLPIVRRADGGRGERMRPIYISISEDYWLTILRGGLANPLNQARTEEIRVGYRFVDENLWRDTWYNPATKEENDARKRKILTGIENLSVEVLAPGTASIAGTWNLTWPPSSGRFTETQLPLAIRIKLELNDMGEITRVFSLLPGVSGEQG